MNKENKYNGVIIYYANELARMCNKFTLEEEKYLHLIFKQINYFEMKRNWIICLNLKFLILKHLKQLKIT